MMIQGSTPRSNRWVVLPMRKPWPDIVGKPLACHILLHLSMNQACFRGDKEPSAVSKAKRGVSGGRLVFKERWCSKARVGLHWHVESGMLIWSPLGLVFDRGILKLM